MSNIDHIEFSKYKRFFAFGCSMTNYFWPTWADIIGQDIPEYYNFGLKGAGNIFISNKLFEMNQRFSFSDNDLIIVMWSAINREDRYINGVWECHGNVFDNPLYDKTFIKKYVDLRGSLIRDLALISSSYHLLNSLPSDFSMLSMNSIPIIPDIGYESKNFLDDVVELYKPILNEIKPDILTTIFKDHFPLWKIVLTEKYEKKARSWRNVKEWGNRQYIDSHPLPIHHFEYLKKIFDNFSINQSTKTIIKKTTEDLIKNGYDFDWKNGSLDCQGF